MFRKRNLSLTRSSRSSKSPKQPSQPEINISDEVICLSSSSEDEDIPTKTQESHLKTSELPLHEPMEDEIFNNKPKSEKESKTPKLRHLKSSSKSPKNFSLLQSSSATNDVICLLNSSDLLTPPHPSNDKSCNSLHLNGNNTEISHSKEKLASPTSGEDSSSTILYDLSYTSQKSLRTPVKTPNTPKSPKSGSSLKFFSPTKKRLVFKRDGAKRNLGVVFQANKKQFNGEDNIVTHAKFQDDKTLFLRSIIQQYLQTDGLKALLKDESKRLLSNFVHLEEACMRVVCRLYWRQLGWYTNEQLKEIATGKMKFSCSSIDDVLKSLLDNRWITAAQNGGDCNMDFDEYVKLIKRPQILEICRELKLKMHSKQDAVDALRKFCQTTAISNYFGKSGSNRMRVLKMLAAKTGKCFKLSDLARYTLYKLYVLMYMGMEYTIIREKRLELILLHDKIHKETYPIDKSIIVDDATVVFQCQEEFYRYLEAHQLYERFIESTDIQELCDIVTQVYKLYNDIDEDVMSRYKSLSLWLRRFTPANIYVKILENGVQHLKKRKLKEQYTIAVQILDTLISQQAFRLHNQYKWFEEKALILHKHLDRAEEAVYTILEGFKADFSEETKDILRPRAKQIINQRNLNLKDELRQALRVHVEQEYILESSLPADHVNKQPMDNHNQKGKLKFAVRMEQDRSVMSAEEYCVVHYTTNGEFTHGEHWEGRIVTTIFSLLFWDIIYTKPASIPGIFMSHYQRYPSDMFCESFYINRKSIIEERLTFIEQSNDEVIVEMMQNRWEERPEYEVSDICRNIGWPTICAVASCLGARPLAAICRRLAIDYRYTHSGFPDLTLWNVHSKQIKFVEVKTDSDKPSMKQLQWLQYLITHNIQAGFCYVGVNTTRCKARSRETTKAL